MLTTKMEKQKYRPLCSFMAACESAFASFSPARLNQAVKQAQKVKNPAEHLLSQSFKSNTMV